MIPPINMFGQSFRSMNNVMGRLNLLSSAITSSFMSSPFQVSMQQSLQTQNQMNQLMSRKGLQNNLINSSENFLYIVYEF